MKYPIICSLILLLATHVFALDSERKRQCTVQEAIRAEEQASTLKNWDEVYEAYRNFAHCDDGAISEGYSDSISRLLSEKWSSANRLIELTSRDGNFERFVLKHIDELMTPSQAVKIRENAETKCPTHADSLCQAISRRLKEVDEAIKHSNQNKNR